MTIPLERFISNVIDEIPLPSQINKELVFHNIAN